MGKLRRAIQEYFNTTEKEAKGFLILGFLMVFLVFSPFIYKNYLINNQKEIKIEAGFPHEVEPESTSETLIQYFNFNPNEIGQEEWQELGLSPKISQRIEKYNASGGRFIVKSDLKKIYGLPESTYTSLYNYILLPDSTITEKKINRNSKPDQYHKIDINQANTADLKKVKGIGEVFSKRIIKFRDLLGGFYSLNQLYEVYGMDSLTAKELISRSYIDHEYEPKKIRLNDSLIPYHPYLTKDMRFKMVGIKKQYDSLVEEDLTKINISEKNLNRLMPYLSF